MGPGHLRAQVPTHVCILRASGCPAQSVQELKAVGVQEWWLLVAGAFIGRAHIGSSQPWQSLVVVEPQGSTFCCLMSMSHPLHLLHMCGLGHWQPWHSCLSRQHLTMAGSESLETPSHVGTWALLASRELLALLLTVREWLSAHTCPV